MNAAKWRAHSHRARRTARGFRGGEFRPGQVRPIRRSAVGLVLVGLIGAGGCSNSSEGAASGTGRSGATSTSAPPSSAVGSDKGAGFAFGKLLALQSSPDHRIVDSAGRDVLLRGANLTSLGEYWVGDPQNPPTIETTAADWEEMQSRGFSVVRLIISWSRLEPTRGTFSTKYLDTVDTYVRAAAEHGIYTVIDMHQDAYTSTISTPPSQTCPEGTDAARGWDGAPAWATLTDGLSTCTPGERNASPAVRRAWNNFYDNTDGIRDEFVAAWSAVATRFAGRPEVAGYDVLNEPEVSRPSAELTARYDTLIRSCVTAIRAAEAEAKFQHLLFLEPAVPAASVANGMISIDLARIGIDGANIVSAPHNYAESIIPLFTIEQFNESSVAAAGAAGMPLWYGEYGFWDTSAATLDRVARFAADEDRHRLGGAWWQWRQPCGDPHSLGDPARTTHGITHLHFLMCPGDTDGRPTEEFLDVLGRGYPRATPGRLNSLTSSPSDGTMRITATASTPGVALWVWTPTTSTTHTVEVTGLTEVTEHPVKGGRLIEARVASAGEYSLTVSPKP